MVPACVVAWQRDPARATLARTMSDVDEPGGREKIDRVVEARMKLMARLEKQIAATPAMSDSAPLGTGAPNRHGMPRLPIGQSETKKWPVLDLGTKPQIDPASWRLVVDGAVEHPLELRWNDLLALPQTTDTSDFHCVTTWSRMDLEWVGVRVSDLLAQAMPEASARVLFVHGYDGYTTNVPLEEALKPDVLLAHTVDGAPLPLEHGGPLRMITPQLYAWKGAKWVSRIEVLAHDQPGFWEQRGYSNTAHPWRNDRYG
jgi:DMSO/TMAO reductase YedYZ molybdopterin-dependent catalytic subunit